MKKLIMMTLILLSFSMLLACEDATEENQQTTELHTHRTDLLTLTSDYEGKSFLNDGIGEVQLSRCIDGDTTRFIEEGTSGDFSVRYIGVDTPETGRNEEPWAEAASNFVCDVLSNADTIVLEWDSSLSSRTGTYGRHLAFIWYDGRLLNLELIELAFSPSSAITTKYGDVMQNAWYDAMATGRRIHGERDPNYDYNN